MKTIAGLIVGFFMIFVSSIVVAWGYQVFWNNVILNICQMFVTTDIMTTMKISYGACWALSIGKTLIFDRKPMEKEKNIKEVSEVIFSNLIAKIIMIGMTLLVSSIVF
jgi:hypothetical protein